MNKKQLAVVHIAKKQVGMTEDEYRDLLSSVGAKSAKDLTRKTFSIVMRHFEQLGFKTQSRFKSNSETETLPPGKRAYMKKIDAILQDLGEVRAYADRIAKNRFQVEKVHWLHQGQLRKVMQMLIYHQKRQQAKKLNKGA